jgi:hypothetical protein
MNPVLNNDYTVSVNNNFSWLSKQHSKIILIECIKVKKIDYIGIKVTEY